MKTILSFILLFTLSVSYSQEIEGAFGFKFGERYNIDIGKTIMFHKVKNVKIPYRKFQRYDISVNKKQEIFLIRAEYYAPTEANAIYETNLLEQLIEEKYNKKPTKVNTEKDIHYTGITIGKQTIGIVREKKTVRILYRDNELGKDQDKDLKEQRLQKNKKKYLNAL